MSKKSEDQITRELMEFMDTEHYDLKFIASDNPDEEAIQNSINELTNAGFEMFPHIFTTDRGTNCRIHFRKKK